MGSCGLMTERIVTQRSWDTRHVLYFTEVPPNDTPLKLIHKSFEASWGSASKTFHHCQSFDHFLMIFYSLLFFIAQSFLLAWLYSIISLILSSFFFSSLWCWEVFLSPLMPECIVQALDLPPLMIKVVIFTEFVWRVRNCRSLSK